MVVWADLQEKRLSPWQLVSRIGRILPRLLILSLGIGTACMVAGILLVVPGIFLATLTALVVPDLAVANSSAWVALRAGMKLSFKGFWSLFALSVTVAAVTLLLLLACGVDLVHLGSNTNLPWWAGPTTAWAVFVGLFPFVMMDSSVVIALLYRNGIQKQSGIDAMFPALTQL